MANPLAEKQEISLNRQPSQCALPHHMQYQSSPLTSVTVLQNLIGANHLFCALFAHCHCYSIDEC